MTQKLGSPVHTLYFTNENGYLVFLARYRDGSDSIEYLEAGRGCRARVNGMWLGSGDDSQFLADNPEAKLITGNPTMEHETWYELGAYMFYIDEGRISGIGLSPKE